MYFQQHLATFTKTRKIGHQAGVSIGRFSLSGKMEPAGKKKV
jgi:hypothetical protein